MLLATDRTEAAPAELLRTQGELFALFDGTTQDSGNVSYGVRIGSERFFVKTAGDPADRRPLLDHSERIALLRNAARIAASVSHAAVPALRHTIESREGPLLVYDWVEGELVGTVRARRSDPSSAYFRFRSLAPARILMALDVVFDLHDRLAERGWIAVDFYDGCLIYDFVAARIHVVDLDNYRNGPFTNEMGRMFGSTRFMAPEELERGARIDHRTNVFTMGRTLLEFLGDGTDNPASFRGPHGLLEVARRACQTHPSDRFTTMAEFVRAFRTAAGCR
jgi:serine/threonine-protein kinase